jgi:indole-3-glycerol phosphate synthase
VLLIASVLPNKDLGLMLKVAKTVGLQCLIEVRWLRRCATAI